MASGKVLGLLHIRFPDQTEEVREITRTPFNIGRLPAPTNDLQLPDAVVSRQHARLLIEDDRASLIDLNSTHGTLVGQTRLGANVPHPIAYAQRFHIGPYSLQVEPVAPRLEPEVEPRDHQVEGRRAREDGQAAGVGGRPPAPPMPTNGHFAYDGAFGWPPRQSRYVQYLPAIYHDDPLLDRFLMAFEGILTPIEQIVDNFDLYLGPRTAPPFFLDQLAAWLDLTLDEKWPLEKRRAVAAEAMGLYRRRGTRWSLRRHLEIYTGATPEIVEPDDEPHHFRVTLRVPSGQTVDRATVERIVEANKPAHTTYTLEIKSPT